MKTEIRTRLLSRLVLTGAVCLFALSTLASPCLAGQLAAKKPEEFASGIQALELRNWKKAAALLEIAVEKQPEEDGAFTRIYGTGYESYLPHFYLGFALYKQKNCAEAVKQWDLSEKQESVKKTKEYNSLLKYREYCRKQLQGTAAIKMKMPSLVREAPPPPR
jgi:hypothetical protein